MQLLNSKQMSLLLKKNNLYRSELGNIYFVILLFNNASTFITMIDKQLFIDSFKIFDREVVVEIITIFFEEYPQRFEKMDQNMAEQNFKELSFNAHSLKGVVSNFAAPVLFELAKEVEKTASALRDGNIDLDLTRKLNIYYPKMKAATAEFYTDLTELINHYN